MIKPTVGRQVWFWYSADDEKRDVQPEAATVAYVWSDRLVNLQVLDMNGVARSETLVVLRQPEDENGPVGRYATWMPFQVGQARGDQPKPDPGK